MKIALVIGVVLIVVGVFLLYFGGIPYVKEHRAEIGPLKLRAQEEEVIRVQPLISVLILAGGLAAALAGLAARKK